VSLQPSRIRQPRLPGVARRTAARFEGRLLAAFAHRPLVIVVVLGMLTVTVGFAVHGLLHPLRTDYVAMLTGARVLGEGSCLYCHAAQVQAQTVLIGQPHAAFDAFLETPVVALAYRPLLGLAPAGGFLVFLLASAVCAGVSAGLVWRRPGLAELGPAGLGLLALAVFSLPAAWAYQLGQIDALLALPLVAGAVLLAAGHRFPAGLLLSLALLKPQTAWLVPIALLVAGEWRAVLGMAVGVACWSGASLWLVGPGGVGQWLSLLGQQGPSVATSIGLPGAVASLGGNGLGFAAAALLAVVACGWLCWRRSQLAGRPLYALALGVAVSLLLAPHVYSYDLIVAAVPLAVLARRAPAAALAAALLLNAAYVVDTYWIVSGPHLEALALAVIVVLLALPPADPAPATVVEPAATQAPVAISTTTGA
jgi:hypothetical protein